MKVFTTLTVVVLSLLALGTGPCEMMQDITEEEDASLFEDCSSLTCENSLDVHLLLTESQIFNTGQYTFTLQTPDMSVYSIDCYMAYAEEGMSCSTGDLDVMSPIIDLQGKEITLFIKGAPKSVLVTTLYNGYAFANQNLIPTYEEIYPNGEDCEPVCYSGEEYIAVYL